MKSYLYLSPLASCIALTLAMPAHAADPFLLHQKNLQQLKQQFNLNLNTKTKHSALKQALPSNPNSLELISQHTDNKKITHIRMQQYYENFPVIGGYAVVHSNQSATGLLSAQNKATMNGTVYSNLEAELGQAPSQFIQNKDKALAQFKAQFSGEQLSKETITPVVYIDDNNEAHWAYKVSVVVTYTDKIPARPSAIIDATTYAPFKSWNDMRTAVSHVKGYGFGGNKKTGEYSFGDDDQTFPALDITRDDSSKTCYMQNNDVKIIDMKHRYDSNGKPMNFTCQETENSFFWTGYKGDGYDKINGAFSPSNDAMYAGHVIKHMYHDWYGVDVLTNSNGTPMQLVMRVHYGNRYENAFWDGEQMTFGDGESMMYPLVSLGVGAHEISHGFTEQHADLAYYDQSGGMNEAFSDMAAQAAEYYSTKSNSWQIGPEIMKEDSGYDALRYMDRPSLDGMSIDSADEYYPNIDPHYSSGVYNRLYYLISTSEGWNPRSAFDVMVKANMDHWTAYETYCGGAAGILAAAKELDHSDAEISKIKDALAKVAITDYDSCSK